MPKPNQAFSLVFSWANGDGGLTDHKQGGNNPINYDTERQLDPDFTVRKDVVQCLVFDFAQDRIHHDEEADRYLIVSY